MSTSTDAIARLLRTSLDTQLQAWKDERAALQNAQTRIAELDALIAFVESDNRTEMTVAPRSRGTQPGSGSTRNPTG